MILTGNRKRNSKMLERVICMQFRGSLSPSIFKGTLLHYSILFEHTHLIQNQASMHRLVIIDLSASLVSLMKKVLLSEVHGARNHNGFKIIGRLIPSHSTWLPPILLRLNDDKGDA